MKPSRNEELVCRFLSMVLLKSLKDAISRDKVISKLAGNGLYNRSSAPVV
jgi:hypothetical protein